MKFKGIYMDLQSQIIIWTSKGISSMIFDGHSHERSNPGNCLRENLSENLLQPISNSPNKNEGLTIELWAFQKNDFSNRCQTLYGDIMGISQKNDCNCVIWIIDDLPMDLGLPYFQTNPNRRDSTNNCRNYPLLLTLNTLVQRGISSFWEPKSSARCVTGGTIK